jgi:hypothetical protein
MVNDEQSFPDAGDLSVVRLIIESDGKKDDGEKKENEN